MPLLTTPQRTQYVSRCTGVLVCSAIGLSACAPVGSAIWSSSKQLITKPQATAALHTHTQLDPRFEYLYVQVIDTAFFATKVQTQTTAEGTEEAWLTPAHEIFRTLNGRITSTIGSQYADWTRSTTTGLSTWSQIVKQTQSGRTITYLRTRDVEPGGFTGLQEQVTISAIEPPQSHRLLPANAAKNLYWVEERSHFLDRAGRLQHAQVQSIEGQENPLSQPLPPAKFALSIAPLSATKQSPDAVDWVYAEQCLSYKVCLSMQRWPQTQSATVAHE